MNWFKKLFSKRYNGGPYPIEEYRRSIGKPRPEDTFLKRQRVEDLETPIGWATQYIYWCRCGTKLTEGDGNAVCTKCNICYGKLPNFKRP